MIVPLESSCNIKKISLTVKSEIYFNEHEFVFLSFQLVR